MIQKTIQKQLLYKSSSSNSDKNVKQNRSSHKSVYNSTSGLKRELNGHNELSTKEHKKIISAKILPQYPKEITNKKEFRNNNNKTNRNLTQQDLEIIKIFTSPEWSKTPFYTSTNSIINSMVNDNNIQLNTESENILGKTVNESESIEYLDSIQEITDQETEENDYVEEKRDLYFPNESLSSVQIFETEEKELENNQESINESMLENQNDKGFSEGSCSFNSKTQNESNMFSETSNDIFNDFGPQLSSTISNVDKSDKSLKVEQSDGICNEEDECESYSYRESREEKEVSLKSVVSTSKSSSEKIWNDVAFMKHFNFEDFSDSNGSKIVDSSSTGSLNTDVMTRIIRQNKSRNYMTEKQISNESAYKEAMELIFEETKVSLGQLLIEGLYLVSKRHRQDAFKYLGKWLLIQADIRDENKTEEQSISSFGK